MQARFPPIELPKIRIMAVCIHIYREVMCACFVCGRVRKLHKVGYTNDAGKLAFTLPLLMQI